jgi:hypothetical protein
MLDPKQKFRKSLIDLKDVFDRARLHYEWWVALKFEIPSLHQERVPIEIQYFLTHSRFAHYKCMIIDLYMILDTNPRSASLHNLLPKALNLGVIDATENSEVTKRIQTIKPIWEKIRELRHKLFAHTDGDAVYHQTMQGVGLMASDFEKLIDDGLHALEPIWLKHVPGGQAVLNFQRNSYVQHGTKFTHSLLAPYYKTP